MIRYRANGTILVLPQPDISLSGSFFERRYFASVQLKVNDHQE
jgi:hypothetical protein